MGYGQGMSPEEVRRRRAETKRRWKERNPEKWRAMRAAQKQRYLDRKRGPGRTRRALLAAMTKAERAAYDREKRLKAEYGLTAAQYAAMVEAQGGSFSLRRDQYWQVRQALTKGCQFVDVVGFHGDVGLIPLDVIDGVFEVTPDAVQAALEEQRADEADDNAVGR